MTDDRGQRTGDRVQRAAGSRQKAETGRRTELPGSSGNDLPSGVSHRSSPSDMSLNADPSSVVNHQSSVFRSRYSAHALSKRLFDLCSSLVLLLVISPFFLALWIAVKITSKGPAFFVSDRIGRHNRIFKMYKFRTMRIDTPQLATHLMTDPGKYLTPIGSFLRKTSLDELPQLLNVIRGDMAVVGPRPALFNQDDLIALRTEKGVHVLVPGITGWAQTNGRDEIPIPLKVDLDEYYLKHQSFGLDMKILWLTVLHAVGGKDVSH